MKEITGSIKELEQKISKHQKEIAALEDAIRRRKKGKLILCEYCKKRTRLDKLVFVQDYWYDENTGSPCGGNWFENDNSSYYICPKCLENNRIYCRGRKDEKMLLEHKYLFKAIWRRHDYGYGNGVKITKPGDDRY